MSTRKRLAVAQLEKSIVTLPLADTLGLIVPYEIGNGGDVRIGVQAGSEV